ncbi:MAG: hypothetical protein HMLIMOIP_002101 [Candidatus Nitrosomirales archaeon]|jgi:hypothetical protein
MNQIDEWVSQEFQNLAEVLADYDRFLALEMVPLSEWGNLIDKSKVFRVVDTRKNQIVCYADSLSSPQDILARVWSMDQNKNNVVANLDARNAAAQALMMKKHMDELEAQKDFALFVARNQKSNWHHEGRVRDEHFRDLGPVRKVIE